MSPPVAASITADRALRPFFAGSEEAFKQFGAAGPHQAGDADDFAAAEMK